MHTVTQDFFHETIPTNFTSESKKTTGRCFMEKLTTKLIFHSKHFRTFFIFIRQTSPLTSGTLCIDETFKLFEIRQVEFVFGMMWILAEISAKLYRVV